MLYYAGIYSVNLKKFKASGAYELPYVALLHEMGLVFTYRYEMIKELIDYSDLVDEAMHGIVKKSLRTFSEAQERGEHHFFISFMTHYPGIVLSHKLRNKYPDEMTIVLQYQFDEFEVFEDKFSVVLSFDNVKERIEIPFKALTAFADPSVKFGLQFKHYDEDLGYQGGDLDEDDIVSIAIDEVEKHLVQNKVAASSSKNNVVMLDAFRKKK